jgi:endonuclease III
MNKNEGVRVRKILELLRKRYPDAKIALRYSNNWELLVAVILSAQCTDTMVNKVTEKLFVKYSSVSEYVNAAEKAFERDIRSTGFYRNKANHIRKAASIILKKFGGIVPDTMEELVSLPGVGRKTANIVLGNAFGKIEGIAVDTHVRRLSVRLGLTKEHDPEKIEQDLMKIVPKEDWITITYLLIEHGRAVCDAKKPLCDRCVLSRMCPSAFHFPHFGKNRHSLDRKKP